MVIVRAGETEKGRAISDPAPRCWPNNAYFLNLLLTAARPTRPGPKRRSAEGRGTVLVVPEPVGVYPPVGAFEGSIEKYVYTNGDARVPPSTNNCP